MSTAIVTSASVRKMTVEVKAVTVNGKSMTLNVFRQIPLERVINSCIPIPEFKGPVWGWVNHFWEKDDYTKQLTPHPDYTYHVLWLKGDQLRRSYVPRREVPELSIFPLDVEESRQQQPLKTVYTVRAAPCVGDYHNISWYDVLKLRPPETAISEDSVGWPSSLTEAQKKRMQDRVRAEHDAFVPVIRAAYAVYRAKYLQLISEVTTAGQLFIGGG